MSVTNKVKRETAMDAIIMLINRLVTKHGHNSEYWERFLQSTQLYSDILNVETGLWGEGTMYLYAQLIKEVGELV